MAETEIERGESTARWSAIWGMAVGVFALVMAEMLPASLLTPMARGLSITEGMAGQAVTATAIIGFLTSLLITALTRRVDRRHMLLSFSILLIVANLMTALAGGLPMLLTGRLLLGFALGGFWTMAAATAMRLVPPDAVPRALSVVFGGVSVATVVTGPLGSLLGDYIGWRGVYLVGAAVGVVGFLWQITTLPSLPSSSNATLATLLHVLKRRQIVPGMAAVLLVFTGHFAFFTYLRPFLETVTRVQGSLLSAILLVFGLANVVGTAASGWLLGRGLRFTLAVVPAGFTLIAVVLASLGGATPIDTPLVALWGFGFGAVPVAWTTWVTRAVPDEAESGSGLLVAAIQLAMAIGAGAGGNVIRSCRHQRRFSGERRGDRLGCRDHSDRFAPVSRDTRVSAVRVAPAFGSRSTASNGIHIQRPNHRHAARYFRIMRAASARTSLDPMGVTP